MTADPTPYRSGRDEEPAAGPGQTDRDVESSLPPGVATRDASAKPGDVDGATPSEGDPASQRMEP